MRAIKAAAALIAATTVSTTAQGAGFALGDKSVSSLGNAFAGAAAKADDASALYGNPATLTQLDGSNLTLAVRRISAEAEFTDGGSNTTGANSTTGSTASYVPSAYYVTDFYGEGMRAGIGLYTPFGLGLEYDDDWKGRYHSIESTLRTINISPTLAYGNGSGLSFGASLDIQYAEARLKQAVDFGTICVAQLGAATCSGLGLTPQGSDGYQTLTGDSWSYGFSLGLAYALGDRTRIGAAWHGPVTQELEGDSDFSNVPAAFAGTFSDSDGDVTIELPEMLSISLSHALTDRLTLLADYTWTGWESFDELRVEFSNALPDSVTPQNWNNVSRYSLGLNYRLSPAWLLRAGIALDETPIPDAQHRSPRIPDDDRIWYTFGFNWALDDTLSMDFAYAYVPADDVPIDNTDSLNHNLSGSYDVVGQYLSAQVNWNF